LFQPIVLLQPVRSAFTAIAELLVVAYHTIPYHVRLDQELISYASHVVVIVVVVVVVRLLLILLLLLLGRPLHEILGPRRFKSSRDEICHGCYSRKYSSIDGVGFSI